MWQKVLRLANVGVGDNFFDLGGQSFEAVRIAGLVKESLGLSLSLGDIWQHPTIAELASHMLRVSANGAHAGGGPVTINARGEGTPLFLVHPAGGHVMCYRHLGALLNRPVYAFEAPGVDGKTEPLTSVPEMAAHYLAKLEAFHPQGAIVLGGWSSGGPIAFEMALQLSRRGRPIEGVAIFDSPAPMLFDDVTEQDLARWFIEDLNLGQAEKQCLSDWVPTEADDAALLSQVAQRLQSQGLSLGADVDQLSAIYRVFKAIVRANRAYRTTAIDTDLLVIRARDGLVSEFAAHPYADTTHWGWREFTRGTIEGESVSGTHYSLLNAESSPAVASLLEGWLVKRKSERNRDMPYAEA